MTSFVDTVCFCVIVHFLYIENLDQITIYLIDQGLHYYNNTRPTQIHVTPPSIHIYLCANFLQRVTIHSLNYLLYFKTHSKIEQMQQLGMLLQLSRPRYFATLSIS